MKLRHVIVLSLTILTVTLLNPHTYASQEVTQGQLPIIDMHVHATNTGPNFGTIGFRGLKASETPEKLFEETYEQFRRFDIVKAVVSGPLDCVEYWKSKDEDDRIIRGILVMSGPDDWEMDPARFKRLVKSGKIQIFGEIVPILGGSKLTDSGWQPYLKICEQYDVPVSIHTGRIGPSTYKWAPKARLRLGDPYLIEDILVRYPKLRVFLSHAGMEWHEHALVLMDCYPNLYTDLGAILWVKPSLQRYAREFLANAKEEGCLNRVMFGSDQMEWPGGIEFSLEYLNSLDFLTEQDKRDILYNNAARFLRLKEEQ